MTAEPQLSPLQDELKRVEENYRTLLRVTTTPYPVAQTPKEVVWTLNKAKLYRYIPVVPAEERHPVPLLLVFALMNRPSILDLRPGHSFVEYMVKKGFDVYLLDWGAPGPEDRDLKLDDYVLDYLPRAVRKLKAVSGSDEFSVLGWCIGAILTTAYAALRPDDGLRNLILLTAPLNFTDKNGSTFMAWLNRQYFDLDRLLEAFDNMPGEMLDYGAKALKPVENYIGNFLRLWDNIDDPKVVESWHAMNTWVNDLIPMAGQAYRQLIDQLYRRNRLIEGSLTLRGERVDLSSIKASVLELIALSDHIVPPVQSQGVLDLTSSKDKTEVQLKGGHIGMMAGSTAAKGAWPQIEQWLAPRSGKDGPRD